MKKAKIGNIVKPKNYSITSVDKTVLVNNIVDGIYLRENNFWLLVCAIIIACIGLDINSSIIIIVSLLIAPVMGPMLGIGMGYGIFSRELLFSSLKQFSKIIIMTLLLSFLYFLISPSGLPTEQILERTVPNLFDIGIAFFGSIAAMIYTSTRVPAMFIPSAAIAAPVILPLVAAGFGLANSDMNIFRGAISNFFINVMFASLAFFLIVRYMNIPYKKYADIAQRNRMRAAIAGVLLILTIPSVLITFDVVADAGETDQVNRFIREQVRPAKMDVVSWKINKQNEDKILTLYVSSGIVDQIVKDTLNNILPNYIENTRLSIVEVEAGGRSGGEVYNQQLSRIYDETDVLQKQVDSLTKFRPMYNAAPGSPEQMINDLRLLFTNLDTVRITQKGPDGVPAIAIIWKTRKTENLLNENKIIEYVKLKMGFDKLILMKGIYEDSIPRRIR